MNEKKSGKNHEDRSNDINIEIEKQKYPVEVLEKPLNNKDFKN